MRFGPLLGLAKSIFPNLTVEYVPRFTQPPLFVRRKRWENAPADIEAFAGYLRQVLPIKTSLHGVVIVQRGLDRVHYPGGTHALRSGADRRTIGPGFAELVAGVMAVRPDAICVELEALAFADQVSLFLTADTLIAQHGAAFAHAHWMPPGGTLIELQCDRPRLSRRMVPVISRLRGHKAIRVYFPCAVRDGGLTLRIDEIGKVLRVLPPKRNSN